MRATCQHCRVPIDVTDGSLSPRQPHRRSSAGPALGESFVVLPQQHTESRGQVLQATSMHEQLRTVGRLLELSEACDECGVPLCEDLSGRGVCSVVVSCSFSAVLVAGLSKGSEPTPPPSCREAGGTRTHAAALLP